MFLHRAFLVSCSTQYVKRKIQDGPRKWTFCYVSHHHYYYPSFVSLHWQAQFIPIATEYSHWQNLQHSFLHNPSKTSIPVANVAEDLSPSSTEIQIHAWAEQKFLLIISAQQIPFSMVNFNNSICLLSCNC